MRGHFYRRRKNEPRDFMYARVCRAMPADNPPFMNLPDKGKVDIVATESSILEGDDHLSWRDILWYILWLQLAWLAYLYFQMRQLKLSLKQKPGKHLKTAGQKKLD